jgi:hypothetical protein
MKSNSSTDRSNVVPFMWEIMESRENREPIGYGVIPADPYDPTRQLSSASSKSWCERSSTGSDAFGLTSDDKDTKYDD